MQQKGRAEPGNGAEQKVQNAGQNRDAALRRVGGGIAPGGLLRGNDDMKSLAKSTLREAESLYGSSDDMTVVTVRVEERV